MHPFQKAVKLKLARAAEQVEALNQIVSAWIAENPFVAVCELREERLGFRVVQQNFQSPPPLEEWSLLAGECIHNIRSALDNLVFALARLRNDPPAAPDKLQFPIHIDKAKFDKNGRNKLDQLTPEAANVVEMLQPFQRDGSPGNGPENDLLTLLQWLSNTDKHRVPSVVLIAPTDIFHNFSAEFQSEADAAANVLPDTVIWGGPLEPGAVLIELKTRHPLVSAKGSYVGHAIVALQTDSENLAIVQILQNLSQYVSLVCAQFDRFFELP